MIRTQVRLDEAEYRLAKKEAAARGVSLAELIRQAVRQMLPASSNAPWMRYAGFVESGDAGSSQSVDEITHGSRRAI